MTLQSGSDLLVSALEAEGVRCVFGLPGTQTVPLFEALRRSRIRTVLATTELSAAFMAGGWARVTGQPGVCLTIPGPGFTWSLTGVAEALLDSVPLLAITGAAPEQPAGRRFRQQELAQGAIAAPLVKQSFDVKVPEDMATTARAALHAAVDGEPGPVLLQLSSRAMSDDTTTEVLPTSAAGPIAAVPGLESLRSRLASARRPVLLAGQGVQRDAPAFRELAERLGAPVLTTPSGRGVLPEDHPLALGFDAISGCIDAVNELLESADLVLVLGAKLGHNGTGGFSLRIPADRLIHVDASADVPGANYPAALAITAPVALVFRSMLEPPPSKSSWSAEEIGSWRARVRVAPQGLLSPTVAGADGKDPAAFFAALRRAMPRNAILVLDSGLHQGLARRHFPVLEPGGLLFPSDLQSMGFAIPTAIGARLGAPERPVVALLGDGGFTMTGLEVLSAVRERLDLVVIVFVDGELGQIRLHQLVDYGAPHAVHVGYPDIAMIAIALGARYSDAGGGIEAAVRRAIGEGGVTLIEVAVGDSAPIRRAAVAARVREGVRRTIGPGLIRWMKRLFRGG